MSADFANALLQLLIGFALAGMLVSGYQALLNQPPCFDLLHTQPAPAALATVPFLVFAAPFIIMRNTLTDSGRQPRRFAFVMLATILVGFWSMMSGILVVRVLGVVGVIA
ncbi:MAG TPA: hypothetical protein VNZ94_06930 [Xanthobacteraceae bacterium]|nr:hypothetical protein [Xanthobacteraceae bacterium]